MKIIRTMKSYIWFILLWASTSFANLSKLEYLTEEYPPYNFTNAAGEVTGFSVELLQLIWQQSGTSPQPITRQPWARGYHQLSHSNNVVLFSTARTPSREKQFKWACAIGQSHYILLARSRSPITLHTWDDLALYNIGVVRADAAEQLLVDRGIDKTKLVFANRLSQGISLLLAERIDLLATSELVSRETIYQLALSPDLFKMVMVLSSEPLCYAFSLGVDDRDIALFQSALDKALSLGKVKSLQRKYRLVDD